MSLISDLVSKANAIINWQPGVPGFGTTLLGYYGSVRDTVVDLYELVLTKAAGDHTHEGMGGTPILSRGTVGDRLPEGTTLHLRADDPGRVEVIEDGALVATFASDRQPLALPGLLPDDQLSAENNTNLGAVTFGNSGAWAWGHFEAWLEGAAWRIKLEAMMSSGEAASVGLTLVYQVFGPDAAMNPVKTRWQASKAYSLGDRVIPTSPNGHYYQCTTAGTSGSSEPTWPTSGAVSDGAVVWTRMGNGMITLGEYSLTPPAAAYDRFDIDSASLQIPAGAVAAGDRVHFGLWRAAGDTHAGDLLVNELWVVPVEV